MIEIEKMPEQIKKSWRENLTGFELCCVITLQSEMKRRQDTDEVMMIEGETLKCINCGSELVCNNDGPSGKLRWRWNGAE